MYQFRLFTSCAIGRGEEDGSSDITWKAYANETHHGKAKFSFVTVQGENADCTLATWYARVIAFLRFTTKGADDKTSKLSILIIFSAYHKTNFNFFIMMKWCMKWRM